MTHGRGIGFSGGPNFAVKAPSHQWEETVRFYRDVAGLRVLDESDSFVLFEFGASRLWVDRMDGMSQSEVWLELRTDDVRAASKFLKDGGVARRDEIEPLPGSMEGFWISDPSGIIHLVSKGN